MSQTVSTLIPPPTPRPCITRGASRVMRDALATTLATTRWTVGDVVVALAAMGPAPSAPSESQGDCDAPPDHPAAS